MGLCLLFLHTLPVPPPLFAHTFSLFTSKGPTGHGHAVDVVAHKSAFKALLQGILTASGLAPRPRTLFILLPNKSLLPSLTCTSAKSPLLPFSLHYVSLLSSFLDTNPSSSVELHLFKPSWSSVPGEALRRATLSSVQPALVTSPPLPPHDTPFLLWQWDTSFIRQPCHHAWAAVPPSYSHTPPPFVQGILSHRCRASFCNSLQLLSRHSFTADYSDHFCPEANDNTLCPCNGDHPFSPTLSQTPLRHTTLAHLLFVCPLHNDTYLETIAGLSLTHLLTMEAGGRALTNFTWLTQVTMRPLPPRPDPP